MCGKHLGGEFLLPGVAVLPLQRLDHHALADGLGRHLDPLGTAIHDRGDGLEIGLEGPLGAARDLLADTAQVLGTAAVADLVANNGADAGEMTGTGHSANLGKPGWGRGRPVGDVRSALVGA